MSRLHGCAVQATNLLLLLLLAASVASNDGEHAVSWHPLQLLPADQPSQPALSSCGRLLASFAAALPPCAA
jgi:hypothetical protein